MAAHAIALLADAIIEAADLVMEAEHWRDFLVLMRVLELLYRPR